MADDNSKGEPCPMEQSSATKKDTKTDLHRATVTSRAANQ